MNKVAKILLGTALILIFLLLSISLAKQIIKPENVRLAEEQKQTLETANLDTDKDSLPDWEEKLWGTDIGNPDTDADGISDGEEVKLNRNPNGSDTTSSNQTTLDIQNSENFIQPVTQNNKPPTDTPTSTKSTETKTTENPIHVYGNSLATIFSAKSPSTEEETSAFNAVITDGTPNSFDQLALIANKYENLAAAIRKTVPPEKMTILVGELASNYDSQSQTIKNIVSFKSQGKVPGEAYQAHNKNVTATAENLITLFQFFRNQGVIFAPGEPGQIFNLPF